MQVSVYKDVEKSGFAIINTWPNFSNRGSVNHNK